jgi:hypothetical protein
MTLPLDTFREQLGLHPYHFWGLSDPQYTPINSKCSGLVVEEDWQNADAAGRSSIRRAIADATAKLHTYLGFYPEPTYVETAALPWPRFNDAAQVRYRDLDSTGRRIAIAAPDGYIQALGIEQLTLLGTQTVTLTQLGNGQPYYTFSLQQTVAAGQDPNEIAVYFQASDRLNSAPVGERWRIQPIDVQVSGTTATITGRAWLIVQPILYVGFSGALPLDPTLTTTFVTALEVYTRTTNGNGTSVESCQATLIYETNDCGACWGRCCCGSSGTTSSDPGTSGEVIARANIRDSRVGLITPAAAIYDPDTGLWRSEWCCSGSYCDPDRVTLRYLAGVPSESGQMASQWQSIVTKLAAAELKRRICACRDANERLHEFQLDAALESTQTERYRRTDAQMNNPFGTRLGHIQAWLESKDYILRRGHLA